MIKKSTPNEKIQELWKTVNALKIRMDKIVEENMILKQEKEEGLKREYELRIKSDKLHYECKVLKVILKNFIERLSDLGDF